MKSFGTVSPMEVLLSLQSVWLSFPRGRRHVVRVLADVSLDLRAGEVVAVLAQRAQGKTSLLRVAAGMERPDRGSVLFAGEDMWRPPGTRRKKAVGRRRSRAPGGQIAMVRDGEPDVDVPVLEGIVLPLAGTYGGREACERAERALGEVGVHECVTRRWSELTDSERVRVAIAHGIAREPRLLLVDDLTATLGLDETEYIVRLLDRLATERELGVLMSVSDAGATGWSGRVATLAGGDLLAPALPTPADDYPNVVSFPK